MARASGLNIEAKTRGVETQGLALPVLHIDTDATYTLRGGKIVERCADVAMWHLPYATGGGSVVYVAWERVLD